GKNQRLDFMEKGSVSAARVLNKPQTIAGFPIERLLEDAVDLTPSLRLHQSDSAGVIISTEPCEACAANYSRIRETPIDSVYLLNLFRLEWVHCYSNTNSPRNGDDLGSGQC